MIASLLQLELPLLASIVAAFLALVCGVFVIVRSSKSFAVRDGVYALFVIIAAGLWVVAFRPSFAGEKAVTQAAAVTGGSGAGCVSIHPGMKQSEVVQLLGQPATKVPEEDIWGPGATRWTYSGISCRVHLLGDSVHLVD